MALSAACLSEDQFTCSICLEVFNDPVSTPCGHSFCQSCLCCYWDAGIGGGAGGRGAKPYQCPLCKESFRKRPELHINRTLKEITEQFKEMAKSPVAPDGSPGGVEHLSLHPAPALATPRPGELPGDLIAEMQSRFHHLMAPGVPQAGVSHPGVHPGAKVPPAFPAPDHVQHVPPPPYSPPYSTLSRYSLPDDSPALPPCPIHLRGLEFFCRTDSVCVCSICVEAAEHRGHAIVPAHREWNIKKSQLGIAEVELKDLICERERKVEELQCSIREIKAAAERETDGVVRAFSKLISSVERCQAQILEMIKMSLQAAEHRGQSLLNELNDELAVLKNRSTTLNQLTASEDYVLFLKMFPALPTLPQAKDWSGVSVSSQLTSGVILPTVNQMTERLQEEMQKLPEICKQSLAPSAHRPHPKAKRVQEYATDITLDFRTAHPRLVVSADGKQVRCSDRHQAVQDHPERFNRVVCVLAHQGFSSGRHYWEVEVGEKSDWDLGVASWSVNRKGKINASPAHGFWFLSLRDRTNYSVRREPTTNLTVNARPSRIGIYVDCDKGLVSFYNVEARKLIYTFTDRFSDTIHPFFSPCTNKSGENEAPLVICPVAETE
ncbi:tripartite motif-containing protein 72-like [Cololabis saira]|uniref:tripartite motif-containing protein 72-like n=1 Tax=Cololabis saira TaxID=129043 RepID=UPI002AD44079|nr:tripartite motif-containing protein 72-like [Cololabis saira]